MLRNFIIKKWYLKGLYSYGLTVLAAIAATMAFKELYLDELFRYEVVVGKKTEFMDDTLNVLNHRLNSPEYLVRFRDRLQLGKEHLWTQSFLDYFLNRGEVIQITRVRRRQDLLKVEIFLPHDLPTSQVFTAAQATVDILNHEITPPAANIAPESPEGRQELNRFFELRRQLTQKYDPLNKDRFDSITQDPILAAKAVLHFSTASYDEFLKDRETYMTLEKKVMSRSGHSDPLSAQTVNLLAAIAALDEGFQAAQAGEDTMNTNLAAKDMPLAKPLGWIFVFMVLSFTLVLHVWRRPSPDITTKDGTTSH